MSSQHANIHYGRGSDANGIHFFQQIQPHELQHEELKIRRSFVERYWKEVSNPISLKLPNGCEWKMCWEKRGDDIWLLKKYWKSFAKWLRSGDQLVFKYKGESHFEVIIFDESSLEIDYSSIRCISNGDEEESTKRCKVVEEEERDNNDECVEIKIEREKPSQLKSGKTKINMMDSHATHQNVSGDNNGSIEENPNFTVKLSRTCAQGERFRMPRWFSKKYRNELEGTTAAINCVGEERTWKMKLKLDAAKGNFALTSGWKSFSQKPDLQVGDYCKFEMTQLKPVAFIVTITRAKDEPHPDKFQGFGHKANQLHHDKSEKLPVDQSRSYGETHGSKDSDSPNLQNQFLLHVSSILKLKAPTELIKRYNICTGNLVVLKVGEQSWPVKVRYFPQLDYWRFSEGWLEFVSGSNLKIGDTCVFDMIDEENLMFTVSIVLD